jgi:hypothetical protein
MTLAEWGGKNNEKTRVEVPTAVNMMIQVPERRI